MVFEPSSITYLDAFPVGPDIPVGELVNELHQTGDNSVQTILWEGREGGGRHELFRLVYFPFILSHKAFSSSLTVRERDAITHFPSPPSQT